LPHRSKLGWLGILRAACVQGWLSRFLLVVATFLLAANPVTQHFWTWDRFLHGGHDVETNLILMVAALCLVMVLAQRMQPRAGSPAACLWSPASPNRSPSGQRRPFCLTRPYPAASPPERVCNLPLLI
jgi:hypothetical protein